MTFPGGLSADEVIDAPLREAAAVFRERRIFPVFIAGADLKQVPYLLCSGSMSTATVLGLLIDLLDRVNNGTVTIQRLTGEGISP